MVTKKNTNGWTDSLANGPANPNAAWDQINRPRRPKAIEVVQSLGGLWIVAKGEGEIPDGGTGNTIMTLGYDPRTTAIGTFIGSMMMHLWILQWLTRCSWRRR